MSPGEESQRHGHSHEPARSRHSSPQPGDSPRPPPWAGPQHGGPGAPYVDGLSVDVGADRGSRGRGVRHSVSTCFADIDLRGGDLQGSAGHLRTERTSPPREGLGYLLPKMGFRFTVTEKKIIS